MVELVGIDLVLRIRPLGESMLRIVGKTLLGLIGRVHRDEIARAVVGQLGHPTDWIGDRRELVQNIRDLTSGIIG